MTGGIFLSVMVLSPLSAPPPSSAPRWALGLSELETAKLATEMLWGRGTDARLCGGSGLRPCLLQVPVGPVACGPEAQGPGGSRRGWRSGGVGEGAGKWKWELAVPALSLVSFLGPGEAGGTGWGARRHQPRPLRPPQDLTTQLSRTGTLSRKSIKAPATPASATLG